MKRLAFLLFLVLSMTFPLVPGSGTAQDFGLEEGDGAGVALPKDAGAAEAAGSVESGPALVLAAPGNADIGQPFLVRLTSDQPLESVSVHWLGKEVVPSISVWNNRHVALVMLGSDVLDARPGKQELTVIASVDGKENTLRRSLRLRSRDYPKQELTLPPSMVTPPQSVYDRISAERGQTAAAKNTTSAQRLWRLPLLRPVDGDMTSAYGLQRILNGKPKNPHRGNDFRSPMGNPVKAAADGVVILVGDHYYAGNSVYIDHGNGMVTMYFHLSKPIVKEGDKVQRGQAIGLSGMSGRATGPHLHFSVSVLGELVDPEPLFKGGVDAFLD